MAFEDDDMALKWMDETCVRYLEMIHHQHGGTGSVLRSKRLDRFACVALLMTILFFHRVQMLLLSWSTGMFFSLFFAWVSVMFTLLELGIVNMICIACKWETTSWRDKLIAQLEAYAEPA